MKSGADAATRAEDTPRAQLIADVASTRPFVVEDATARSLHFSYGAVQSAMDLEHPCALVAAYTQKMMAFLLLMPMPRHIVLIGLGGGSLAKFCHKHLPSTRITAVEIDPRVLALRQRFHIPADDGRLNVLHEDGASYLITSRKRADAILIDAFDECGVAPSFAAPEVYQAAFDRLSPEGALVMNLAGPKSRYVAPLESIRRSFSALRIVHVADEDNLLAIASKRPDILVLPEYLDRRAHTLEQHLGLDFRRFLQRLRDSPLLGSHGSAGALEKCKR